MKIVALFSLSTGLAAAIAAVILKARAIRKAGKSEKRDGLTIVLLLVFAIVMIINIVFTAIYF